MWLPETLDPSKQDEVEKSAVDKSRLQSFLQHWGTPLGRLFGVCLVYFLAFSMMESVFALFNERVWGWGAQETGRYFAFIGLVIALIQGLVVPRLVPWMGEIRALGAGLLTLAIGFSAQALTPQLGVGNPSSGLTPAGLAIFLVAGLFMAVGNALVSASSSVLVSVLSPADQQGLNMGLRESVSAIGRIVGPMGAGVLFAQVNPAAPLWVAGGLSLLSLLLVARMGGDASKLRDSEEDPVNGAQAPSSG